MITAALAGVLALTGCSTGLDAEVVQVYDAGAGVNDRSSEVYVLNALVVANDENSGTLSVSLLDKTEDGDELVGVEATTSDGEPLKAKPTVEQIELCAEQLVVLGRYGEVIVSGEAFTAGDMLDMTFSFREAAPVRLNVPVVTRQTARADGGTDPYDEIAATPGEVPEAVAECEPGNRILTD